MESGEHETFYTKKENLKSIGSKSMDGVLKTLSLY